MQYKQIPPPDFLKDYIRYFWILESGDEDAPTSFRTIADGSTGLIFQHPDKGALYQNNKLLPDVFAYGQATTHATLRASDRFSTIGTFFYPNALKTIFGFNADELTDSCTNLDDLKEKRESPLSEQLANTEDLNSRIILLSSWLQTQIQRNHHSEDEAIQYVLRRIVQTKGSIPLKELHAMAHLSERTFERKFKQYVGVPPKLFSRIVRFQASFQQMNNNDYDKLSDLAFNHEYADQSHFIRAFKEFTGYSPLQYQKAAAEVIVLV